MGLLCAVNRYATKKKEKNERKKKGKKNELHGEKSDWSSAGGECLSRNGRVKCHAYGTDPMCIESKEQGFGGKA